MLPFAQRIAFLLFACAAFGWAFHTWRRMYRRIAIGRPDTDQRWNDLPRRLSYALVTTFTQRRTFRDRPSISFLHSLIFYGFVYYLLVNTVDGLEGFVSFSISSQTALGAAYNATADVASALVLFAVVALILRRFVLPSRRDFSFNERTLLHPELKSGYVRADSLLVSTFILVHVGSRAIGAAALVKAQGGDRFRPFATLVAHALSMHHLEAWRIVGYWGGLGSVLAFLGYFPRSKHIHIFMASTKYFVSRQQATGVLPAVDLEASDDLQLGAERLEELAWPRLLDAYACIQCNRCQDVCPATATGKSLSPSALEINKRMELNVLARNIPEFEAGSPSPLPLLEFALTPEAAWACTTCGACLDVCPVEDEPMLDIIDVRRQQVMMEGAFPSQLQNAFRGMERSQNPWGINQEKRLDWADGLAVRTTDENPDSDILYWVGCAASYDPQAQKTARALVQLMNYAGVDFAVLGKRECCSGDSARRAGNELLYQQLAKGNISTLNAVKPKRIVASCPHCMNAIGKEYAQLGGDYTVVHHTQFLDELVEQGKLTATLDSVPVAFHDPCYLGRHNGVFDSPRTLLKVLSNDVVELDRNREKSFCCGAGGAQFWKEEEPGTQRISDNRFAEAQRTLASREHGVLATGCPFCKSMLQSTPANEATGLEVRDVAELLLEAVQRKLGQASLESAGEGAIQTIESDLGPGDPALVATSLELPLASHGDAKQSEELPSSQPHEGSASLAPRASEPPSPVIRKRWVPTRSSPAHPELQAQSGAPESGIEEPSSEQPNTSEPARRKAWVPSKRSSPATEPASAEMIPEPVTEAEPVTVVTPEKTAGRKAWVPKRAAVDESGQVSIAERGSESVAQNSDPAVDSLQSQNAHARKKWVPKRSNPEA